MEYARVIAGYVGRVIEEDSRITVTQDPRFCVEVNFGSLLSSSGQNGNPSEVIIDYDTDPLRCQLCFSHFHGSSQCDLNSPPLQPLGPAQRPRQSRERRKPRSGHTPPTMNPSVREELESGGFTVVEPRKPCRPPHQSTYWREKRGGKKLLQVGEIDTEMTDYLLEDNLSKPPLPAGPRSPNPLPPESPELPLSVAKKMEAMDVEILELFALADSGLLDNVVTSLKE